MIPKIIHCCWLSGEDFPNDVRKCMDSWGKKLPDYEIKLWNTNNFDVNICQYTKEAFSAKKYAFVSDFVRLYALYHYGGIYLDSDIEVLKSMDCFLNEKAFTGFEDESNVAAWILGSEKGNPLFKELMDEYYSRNFIKENGDYDMTPNPKYVTECMVRHGLILKQDIIQKLDYITVFPMDYFCPYNPYRRDTKFTENTYVNHYFNGAWRPDELIYNERLRKKLLDCHMGKAGVLVAAFIAAVKYRGIVAGISDIKNFVLKDKWK